MKSGLNRTVRPDNRKPFTKTILLTSKTGIYEKLSEPCELQFNLTGLKTVDDCHGFRRFNWFRVFFVLTGSTIDEASTSNIEIAPLFVLILLYSLARLLSLRFCWLLFCIFSFSTFRLFLFLFSASFVGLFSDKFYVPILSFLCSFVCIIVFGKSFVKVVGSASVTYILVCKLVSIFPSKKLHYPLYQLICQYTLHPRFYSLTT